MPQTQASRPRLRGVSHLSMFPVAAGFAIPLAFVGKSDAALVSAIVFGAAVTAMFAVSGFYHVITWRPAVRRWLARLDHATVYGLIAATYTPFGLLVLSPGWAIPVLAIVWGGALLAILLKLLWVQAPKWLSAVIGLTLGWVGAVAFSQLLQLPAAAIALVIATGLFYTVGAVIYARRRPNPYPSVFGYHELFHVLTIAAAACEYVAVAFYVLPRA